MTKKEVTVVIPGLAAIVSQAINREVIPFYMRKVIIKANFMPYEMGLSRCLFNHFSEEPLTGTDIPIADLAKPQEQEFVIKADPCYLHPDRDRLLLFSKNLDLTEKESTELIKEIQPLLDELGLISQQSHESWMLKLLVKPNINFYALDEVEGKGVEAYLPSGQDRQQWLRLWNEIQMQLYNSEVNTRRTALNQLPINSVWFWGQGGEYEPVNNSWSSISGQSALLKQLAVRSGHEALYNSSSDLQQFSKGRHLLLLTEIDTELDWQKQLQIMDTKIFEPLWQQLSKMAISKLILQVPDFGEYHLTPISCWRFWQ